MYTMKDWERDGNFSAQVGQLVEEAIYWEFLNCVPPRTNTRTLMQCGEAYGCDSKLNAMLYTTFARTEQGWVFCGHCLEGKTEPRTSYYDAYYTDGLTL